MGKNPLNSLVGFLEKLFFVALGALIVPVIIGKATHPTFAVILGGSTAFLGWLGDRDRWDGNLRRLRKMVGVLMAGLRMAFRIHKANGTTNAETLILRHPPCGLSNRLPVIHCAPWAFDHHFKQPER